MIEVQKENVDNFLVNSITYSSWGDLEKEIREKAINEAISNINNIKTYIKSNIKQEILDRAVATEAFYTVKNLNKAEHIINKKNELNNISLGGNSLNYDTKNDTLGLYEDTYNILKPYLRFAIKL